MIPTVFVTGDTGETREDKVSILVFSTTADTQELLVLQWNGSTFTSTRVPPFTTFPFPLTPGTAWGQFVVGNNDPGTAVVHYDFVADHGQLWDFKTYGFGQPAFAPLYLGALALEDPVVVLRGDPSTDTLGKLKVNMFVRGSDASLLHGVGWDGDPSSMKWENTQRKVAPGKPAVLVRGDPSNTDDTGCLFNVFVRDDQTQNLLEYFWNGSSWTWSDWGKILTAPPAFVVRGDISSVDTSAVKINMFGTGADGRLWESYWNGSSWGWRDTGVGAMPGTPAILMRGNTSGTDNSQVKINLFCRGSNGNLTELYWDSARWSHSDTGIPVSEGTPPCFIRGNAASINDGDVKINLFMRGENGNLWTRYWDGGSWSSNDTGQAIDDHPAVVVQGDLGSTDDSRIRIRVFAPVSQGTLHGIMQYRWDGSAWSWTDVS